MTDGAGYAQRHLEHSDYYDEGRRVQGEWHGQGAELLGLRGEVTREQFEAVREGLHPETGEFLRPRHSADRIDASGSEQSKGRSLYDLTFSAPKSVSIQVLVGGDGRLIAAHYKAVREVLAEAENYAGLCVRLNGANEDRTTANWIVAAYRHDTSRELDPQLHTHAVTANPTYDGVEGRCNGPKRKRRIWSTTSQGKFYSSIVLRVESKSMRRSSSSELKSRASLPGTSMAWSAR